MGTLSHARRRGMLSPVIFLIDAESPKEESVSESSFLSQLEQRTQQVKITLANLEAEKIRIEGLIAQLQPLVPHYDALVAAERRLTETLAPLEAAGLRLRATDRARLERLAGFLDVERSVPDGALELYDIAAQPAQRAELNATAVHARKRIELVSELGDEVPVDLPA